MLKCCTSMAGTFCLANALRHERRATRASQYRFLKIILDGYDETPILMKRRLAGQESEKLQ